MARVDLDRLVDDIALFALDVETTGRSVGHGHRVCEIAVVRVGGHCLFEASTVATVASQIVALCRHGIVVGHNVTFDLEFIASELIRLGQTMPPVWFIDTLGLARRVLTPAPPDWRLSSVAVELGLELPDRLHEALPDARLAAQVFERLAERLSHPTLGAVGTQRISW